MELLGYTAAVLTTASFVPQVVHTFRTRDTGGISLVMYSMFVVGIALWAVYGLVLGDLPIIIANVITLALASSILVLTARTRLAGSDPD